MILRVLVLLLVVYSVDRATEAARYFGDLRFTRKNNDLDAKKARDIISSFVNAWKTSKILPNHQKNQPGETRSLKNYRSQNEEFLRLQPDYSLDRRSFLASRRNKLDKQSLFALENSLDPRPIKKHIRKPDQTEARTYFGGEHSDDEDDISPEMKLASLISKPVYHNMPGSFKHESDDDYKEFMFNNNGDMNDDNSIGLPNDDWRSGKRSSVTIPKGTVRFLAIEDDGNEAENRDKKFAILNAEQLEDIIRRQRNNIPSARKLIDQDIIERLFDERGDKKELITDPYNSLSLPVSDEVKGSEIDRKFYKYLPYRFMSSDYDDEESPAEFKLQKKNLWGDIQKRLRRSKINRKGQALKKLVNVKRSLLDSLGETGNSFDAYGSIGQDMAQSLMKVAADKADNVMKDAPCKQNAKLQENELADPRFSQTNPGGLLDASQLQQDMSRPSDNGIIQIAPEEPQKRSDFNADHVSRHKRAAILMKKKLLQDSMANKASKKLNTANALSSSGAPSSRSLPAHYLGGLPDSRGTESDDGITEDNEEESLDERLAHDSTPLLMKIAQHDGENLHKFWNNEHSAGSGFYTGHGEGPNHAYLGDYFGHGPEEMERDEGVKSLESSPSSEDHHTASLIDSIWEHDLGEDHLGEHHIERHHSAPKIKSYFGSHHAGGILLPAETMDGIDTHWTGHLPHMHASEYEHEGHALQFSPSRIKAIQAIQDDPGIDVELSPHEGIGTPMPGHAHHMHAFHNMDHSYGGMNLAPVVSDPVQVEDSHEEEYKQHIDNLLSQYHGLEEHLRGTGGTLAGHLDHANFGHHGHHQLHTGYDLYAYKNPWEGMRIPYHVPVINHPSGEQEEAPPSPLSFEGKTDEKGAPMVEGGKEEGGKGGPLVEGSKISTIKESKEKEGESSKGAKASANKAPLPVIPKQRGGPEISTGKNETNDNNHVTNGDAKQTMSDNGKTDSKSTAVDKESKSESSTEEHKEKDAKESGNQSSSKENQNSKSVGKDTESKSSDSKDNSELSPTEMFENIMNTNGKQSEMLNNLKAALGDQATNPKSLTALQFARLKQLSTMQQALLSSLAKQAVQASKDSKPDTSGSDINEIKQLVELQNLQQLGAGSKAGSLINALRQNSLLHSLKAAQENILKNAKTHSAIKESSTKNGKQHDLSKLQASDIQGFFGKLPKNSITSDLGDVGSEKFGSKIHASESPTAENDVAVSELIKELELAHAKKSAPAGVEAGVKPALSNLLRESLISNLKTRQTHQIKNKTAKTQNSSSSDKAYSSIGNEGPVTATAEESGHTRTTHLKEKRRSKSQTKHKKLNWEKDMMETGAAKAEILSYDDDKIDEDELSKKNIVKSHHS